MTKYLRTQTLLRERLNDMYKRITDHKRQLDEMVEKREQYANEQSIH